jgi:1-deoxyxylulose-5-phosphate synthase
VENWLRRWKISPGRISVEQQGKELAQVALAWVLTQLGITCAILGASKPSQLEESLHGVGMTLDEELLQACNETWFSIPRERDPLLARR